MFKVGSSDYDYYDILISNETSTFGVDLKNINRKNLVEKFNIKNNIDLIKYIINHYDNSVNIFFFFCYFQFHNLPPLQQKNQLVFN